MRYAWIAGWLLGLGMLAACSREEPVRVLHFDLTELFPHTTAGEELSEIDLGTREGNSRLLDGWSDGDPLPSGESVVYATNRKAAARFSVGEPSERRLIVRCGLAAGSQEPSVSKRPMPVMVSLNRRRLGMLRVSQEMQEHELKLPSRAQQSGENVITLDHPLLPFRSTRRSAAMFRQAVAYDWIRIETPEQISEPRPHLSRSTAGDEALVLPAGTQVEYFVRVPSAGQLSFAMQPDPGEHAARLRVMLDQEGRSQRTVFEAKAVSRNSESVGINLAAHASEVVRLTLGAVGEGVARLVRPQLLGAVAGSVDPGRGAANFTPLAQDERGTRPNILLYVIDTLRADHLGCYGYRLPTSPNIDALAEDGLLFSHTVAQASWTRPAVASILTGLYPFAHGAITLQQGIRPGAATLAELLHARGYRTAAFITNVNVSGQLGFRRGFDSFTYLPEEEKHRKSVHVLSDELNRAVFPWFDGAGDQPFFLYVHASDPHAPYTPPPELAARFRPAGGSEALALLDEPLRRMIRDPALVTAENLATLVSLYDAEIAFNDASFGQLVAELKRRGLYERTLIVLVADHGEEFNDHGRFEHGHTLFDELIHVPLIMRFPGGKLSGGRSSILARQIDVLPTLLSYLGIPVPAGLPGRALLQRNDDAGVEAFSHTKLGSRELTGIVTPTWKVVHVFGRARDGFEVYDLTADPAERRNVAADHPILLGYGRQTLSRWTAEMPRPKIGASAREAPEIDPETEKRLRALGYVN